MRNRMRNWGNRSGRPSAVFAASLVVVALAACGEAGSGPAASGTPPAPPTPATTATTATTGDATPAPTATTTVTAPGRIVATTVTITGAGPAAEPATGATSGPGRSALDGLQGYLTRVASADARIAAVARLINGDTTASGMRIRPATRSAIAALQLGDVARALPAGMSTELTRRALLVYSELSSRRAALTAVGGLTPGPDGIAVVRKGTAGWDLVQGCLASGAKAKARFAPDVAALRTLAAGSKPFTAPPAAARATGEILVRTVYIDGWNGCCNSCGGYVTDRLAPVVWQPKDSGNGEHVDGTIDGVGFEASYRSGSGWRVVVHAG